MCTCKEACLCVVPAWIHVLARTLHWPVLHSCCVSVCIFVHLHTTSSMCGCVYVRVWKCVWHHMCSCVLCSCREGRIHCVHMCVCTHVWAPACFCVYVWLCLPWEGDLTQAWLEGGGTARCRVLNALHVTPHWHSPQSLLHPQLNNSDSGLFTVFTGVQDFSRIHLVDKWNGLSKVRAWGRGWVGGWKGSMRTVHAHPGGC